MNLIFLDLETTGVLTPQGNVPAGGCILELAMLAVHPQTLQEVHAFSTPIAVAPQVFADLQRDNPFVYDMHTQNGLIAEILAGRAPSRRGPDRDSDLPSVAEAEAMAMRWFDMAGGATDQGRSPLCGANVHFDLRWLQQAGMPGLALTFNHRILDSNFCWQIGEFICGRPAQKKLDVAHRALADCRQSVQTIRTFLGG